MLKYYLSLYLLLYFIQTYSQNGLIAKQGFERSGDTWPIAFISSPPCTQDDDIWDYSSNLGGMVPIEENYFWGIQDLNGNCGSSGFEHIELNSYDLSNYRNVILSFDYFVQGFDNGDDMKYEVWLDEKSQGEVIFIDGQNNLTSDQWTTIKVEIPNRAAAVKLRISIKQNGTDQAGIDNIRLEGSPINTCSELMISEYLEGGSSKNYRNNYIELYNSSNVSVDLDDYQLVKYTGGNLQSSGAIQLTGKLKPFASYLIEDHTEALNIEADLSTNSSVMDFNGDDKIALLKSDLIIDLIGVPGDSSYFASDVTLRRRSQVKAPNNEFNNTEWETYGFQVTDNLGSHASFCQGNLPEIEIYGNGEPILDGSNSSSLLNNTYFGAWRVSQDSLIQRSFVIKNTGTEVLEIEEILISGQHAAMFSTEFQNGAAVSVNDSIQFSVHYRPTQMGLHSATLQIINSDPSESSFEFLLQGEGTGSVNHPLLISQYYEGDANNKWIEISNISNVTSPENTYFLALYRNEATQHPIGIKPSYKKMIPAIPPGQTIKYSAILNVTKPAYAIDNNEIRTSVCSFTGDDIIVISTSDAESCWSDRTDIIGKPGDWGSNVSMVRNYGCNASSANTGFQISDWLLYPTDSIDLAAPYSNLRIGIHHSGETRWKGGNWTNGKPDLKRKVILESSYHTDLYGGFKACSLHILKDVNLFIKALDQVIIHKDILVEGTLDIAHQASLVMIDNQGKVSNLGKIYVHKSTGEIKPYDYTYWSSPVGNAQLEKVFPNSPKNSFYYFSPEQFEDRNNDGLDDNSNAWVRISGGMEPGRGYTAMAPDTNPFVENQQVTFEGVINNGPIRTPLNINSSSLPGAAHWNLLGNPYPSAIDANLLLKEPENKGLLAGTFYFWTHSTAAQIDESSGNRIYSSNDYAMYTVGTGGIRSQPDGKQPSQYISSCQGFFVQALKEGNLVFNNNMRSTVGDDNFFKTKSIKGPYEENKIWLNLTNKDGLFSQILIGCIKGATNEFDPDYDGIRIDIQKPVFFYSHVNGQQFAIQGLPAFDGDEKIRLGIHNSIEGRTYLKISIDHLKGNFSNAPIILHDKLLNEKHNLRLSAYEFTLEKTGKINDRFELVFDAELTQNQIGNDNKSTIIWQLADDILYIRTKGYETIRRLEIFDLNGRKLKDLNANRNSIYINWSGFPSRAIYIMRASLQNNKTIVTKLVP